MRYPKPNASRGIARNWEQKPTTGPIGLLKVDESDYWMKVTESLLYNQDDLLDVNLHAHNEESQAQAHTHHQCC